MKGHRVERDQETFFKGEKRGGGRDLPKRNFEVVVRRMNRHKRRQQHSREGQQELQVWSVLRNIRKSRDIKVGDEVFLCEVVDTELSQRQEGQNEG